MVGAAQHREPGAEADAIERSPNRRRRRQLVGVLLVATAVVALLVAVGAFRGASESSLLTVKGGGQAPLFDLPNVREGERKVALASFRGKPVVINFFASWCIPCRQEMPALEAEYQRVRSRVAFIGVDNQDSRNDGLQLLNKTSVQYPAGFDPNGTVAAAYGLFGMPTTIFVSPAGKILERRTGAFTRPELQQTLDRLFPG